MALHRRCFSRTISSQIKAPFGKLKMGFCAHLESLPLHLAFVFFQWHRKVHNKASMFCARPCIKKCGFYNSHNTVKTMPHANWGLIFQKRNFYPAIRRVFASACWNNTVSTFAVNNLPMLYHLALCVQAQVLLSLEFANMYQRSILV